MTAFGIRTIKGMKYIFTGQRLGVVAIVGMQKLGSWKAAVISIDRMRMTSRKSSPLMIPWKQSEWRPRDDEKERKP
jgi:hypothetical protein